MNLAARLPRVPRSCFWELTLACNLRCITCEVDAGESARDELSTEEALRVATELAVSGCEKVCLTGGEPLLREDWPVIAHRLAQLGLEVTLITNGVLVDRGMIGRVREAGITGLSVSLDGNQAVHDAIRIPHHHSTDSSYESARSAIRLAREAQLKTAVITQIHRYNLGDLQRMYRELVSWGVRAWQVQLSMPLGRMPKHAMDYLVLPAQLVELERTLAHLVEDGRLTLAVGDNIGYFGRHEPVLRGAVRRTQSFWLGCPAGCRVVSIGANGDVKGCPSHPRKLVAGNLRVMPFSEIWADRQRFSYNTAWDESLLEGRCRQCPYRRLCRAGCTTMALATSGSIYQNPYCLQHGLMPGDGQASVTAD
jgi:radical SAM protein with 4Fe4S-binding SPASM domain